MLQDKIVIRGAREHASKGRGAWGVSPLLPTRYSEVI
jgi:hypothetical protein